MLTLKACSSGWTPAHDAYNGLANFPVSQPGVREHFYNYCPTRNFNRLSCRCTPVTSANDGASCGFAIFRRVARKWPDQSIQERNPGTIAIVLDGDSGGSALISDPVARTGALASGAVTRVSELACIGCGCLSDRKS